MVLLVAPQLVAQLPDVSELDESERSALRGFLEHTDQVKFAEHRPTEAEIESTYEGALGFVEATQPREEPESEPEEELAA